MASKLRVRPKQGHGLVTSVTPQSAGWRHVGFDLHRLRPGDRAAAATGGREVCLVLVSGKGVVSAGGRDLGEIGARMSPFEGRPWSVYVPQGFAFQRVYTDARADGSREIDETFAVEDGDVVLVPKGYHPCAALHGYDLYYLNVMAGPVRTWKFHNEPAHEWLLKA